MNYLGTSLTSVSSRTPSISLPSQESPRQRRHDPFMRDHGGSGNFSKDLKMVDTFVYKLYISQGGRNISPSDRTLVLQKER